MSEKAPVNVNYVAIKPTGEGRINIHSRFTFRTKPDGNRLVGYIPTFDIYFSAENSDSALVKAKAHVRMMCDHYMLNTKGGIKDFVLFLHKRGFKANNDVSTVHNLINHRVVPAKFRSMSSVLPEEFGASESIEAESEMEIAV